MATYSGAISLELTTFNTSIPSSGGVISSGTVVYEVPASKKAILMLTNFQNQLAGSVTLNLAIQKKDPQTSTYFETLGSGFTFTGSGGPTTPFRAQMSSSALQVIIDAGISDSKYFGTLGLNCNTRIILEPGDRIVTTGGSTADGSNLRACGQIELYSSAF